MRLVVAPGAAIAGTVDGPAGPLTGAAVTLQTADGTRLEETRCAFDGAFRFRGLRAGAYRVVARGEGLVSERRDVSAGETGVTIVLRAGRDVRGRVRRGSDAVAQAVVVFLATATQDLVTVRCDGQGAFVARGLTDGEHEIFVRYLSDGRFVEEALDPVTLGRGHGDDDLDLEVP